MNQPSFFQRFRPHLLVILGFLVLASIYFLPAWQGKELQMNDVRQGYAATKELRDFKAQTGEYPLWTDALFGGMPAYMIVFNYPNTFVGNAVDFVLNMLPRPVALLLICMVSMYILLLVIGINRWLAVLGAAAYSLGSYLIISLGAGHVSKVMALAYAPGILAGIILALRGQYLVGGALTALFVCLELNANHVQITYYLFMTAGIYVLMEGIHLLRSGKGKQLGIALGVLLIAGTLGAGSFSKRLLVLNQYSKETIRGGSELTAKTTAQATKGQPAPNKAAPQNGLDETYAFSYSYELPEVFTLLIPNFYGGASNGGLDEKSALYGAMVNRGLDPGAARQFVELAAPVYWGDMPIVGGPAYAGALLIFLFVLGMVLSQNRIKWFFLASTLLLIVIACGKNLLFINGLLFDYFPFFNKFRAVTMTLNLVQLFLAAGAALGVQALVDQKPTLANIRRPLLISFVATGGVALLMALLGGTFFSFHKATDQAFMEQYFGQVAGEMVNALVQDRQSVLRSDSFRSFIFIALGAGAIFLFATNRLKPLLFYPILLALVVIDLFAVDKRFLSNTDFVPKSQVNNQFEPSPADQQILLDKSLSYRVWDQASDFMSSNRASYFHKSIGGYHAAKLHRYQDLIEYVLPKNTVAVLNMLNTKYIIQQSMDSTGQGGAPFAQINPDALGNAWFVRNVQQVNNADEEVAAIQLFNPGITAVVDKRFASQLTGLGSLDTTGSIRLTKYIPDNLTYESDAPGERLAVFSEIYYRGDSDWKVTIDGKEVPHLRADYTLRALRIPAGKHTINFKFDPPVVRLGDTLDLVANILLILFLAGAVVQTQRTNRKSAASEPQVEPSAPVEPEPVVAPAKPTKTGKKK